MSEFDIFDLDIPSSECQPKMDENNSTGDMSKCRHTNVISDNSNTTCLDCGIMLGLTESHYIDKEWNWYPEKVSDTNRVQKRKTEYKNIFKDIDKFDIPNDIKTEANKIYFQIVKQKICRGNIRKALIYACILKSYKKHGKQYSYENLMKKFNITKKHCLKGIKMVAMYYKNDDNDFTKDNDYQYIKPLHLIEDIMSQLDANEEQKTQVINLYKSVEDKSNTIKRSRPKSTACSVVFFWILKNNYPITMKEFASKVHISELTINKIIVNIKQILDE